MCIFFRNANGHAISFPHYNPTAAADIPSASHPAAGADSQLPKTITSTAEHLYWDTTTHAWTPADNLNVGDQLDTPDNGHATIVATKHCTAIRITWVSPASFTEIR